MRRAAGRWRGEAQPLRGSEKEKVCILLEGMQRSNVMLPPGYHTTLPLAPTPASALGWHCHHLPSTEDRQGLLTVSEVQEENPALWTQA